MTGTGGMPETTASPTGYGADLKHSLAGAVRSPEDVDLSPGRSHDILLMLLVGAPIISGFWQQTLSATEAADGSVSVKNMATMAILGLGCAAAVLLGTRVRLPTKKGAGWLIAFLAFSAASAMWSEASLATLLKSAQLIALYACALLAVGLARNGRQLLNAVVHAYWLACASALLGVLLWPARALAGDATNSANSWRLQGLYPSIGANDIGFAAGVALTLMLFGYGFSRSRRSAPLALKVAMLMVPAFCLIASKARTGWIATLIAVILLTWQLSDRRKRGNRLLLAGIFAVILLGIVGADAASDFATRGEVERESLGTMTGRTTLWTTVLRENPGNPLIGNGYYYGHRLLVDELAGDPNSPISHSNGDNSWIDTYLDTGIVGLSLALATMTFTLRAHIRRPGPSSNVMAALGLFVLVVSLANPSFHAPGLRVPLFGLVVFSAARTGARRSTLPPRSRVLKS